MWIDYGKPAIKCHGQNDEGPGHHRCQHHVQIYRAVPAKVWWEINLEKESRTVRHF